MNAFAVAIPLGLIAASGYFAFSQIKEHKTKESYYLYAFCLLLFMVTYSVSVLKVKIGGAVNIETAAREVQEAREDVYARQREVNEIGRLIYETSFILLDGQGRFGGMPNAHKAEFSKRAERLEELLRTSHPMLKRDTQALVKELDKKAGG